VTPSMRLFAIALLGAAAGCSTFEAAPGATDSPSIPSMPGYRPDAAQAEVECTRDVDCVLLPYVTCCGECPPVPPFDVGPISHLDAILIESEQVCAERRATCEVPLECEPVPAGCEARASCVSGACVVVEAGCGASIS